MPVLTPIFVLERRALSRRVVVNLDSLKRLEEVEVLTDRGDHGTRATQPGRGEAAVGRGTSEGPFPFSQVDRQMSHRDELDRPGQLSPDLHGRAF
jgi:hypothetical protein